MYLSAFCIAMSRLKRLVWSIVFFTQPLVQTWLIQDRTSVKLNFTFFCVPRYKLLLYITSKVVSNVTKPSASDDWLHVNCNVTNRTQTCFRSTQVVYCLPGVWVLVLYWRSFYFVVIVESLLLIFVYRSFCFRCSAVCFGAVCTEGNAVSFKFREVLAAQMGVMRRSIKVSSFEMHKYGPFFISLNLKLVTSRQSFRWSLCILKNLGLFL